MPTESPLNQILNTVSTALKPKTKKNRNANKNQYSNRRPKSHKKNIYQSPQNNSKAGKYRFTNSLSLSDASLIQSVDQMSNSYFFPQHGVFRGQSKAFEESGLATLTGSLITSNATAANNVFSFIFRPAICNTLGWLTYGYGTNVSNALTVTPTQVAAIVTNTQAESFRVVSATFQLTPQGSFTNQAGSGLTGYVPDTLNFVNDPTAISNLRIRRAFKGVDSQILHWLPSENSGLDETEFLSIASTPASASEYIGFINIPTASDQVTTFQIDYSLSLEYIPSPAYRPWVDICAPMQDIRSQQYVNFIASRNWDPLMIGEIKEYEARVLEHELLDGGHKRRYAITNNNYHEQDPFNIGLANNTGIMDTVGQNVLHFGKEALKSVGRGMIDQINMSIPGTQFDLPVPMLLNSY